MAHKNIPIFIPHIGCPNTCVFCNQRSISGRISFDPEVVPSIIENALETVDPTADEVEIAFFGGSFTGIEREQMVYLLSCAKKYIDEKKVSSIRLSTRPDYIDGEILSILKRYGVKNIELGIQSLSDKVLKSSKRGHSAGDSERACKLIKDQGFDLVGQMMLGLPSSDFEAELMTARRLCELGVDAVRIYPTAVFCKTELNDMMIKGEYTPLDVEEAAERAAEILLLIDQYGVPCIRCGLQAQENLSDQSVVTSGAYHPSFGSIAMGKVMRRTVASCLDKEGFEKPLRRCQMRFAVAPERVFDASGYKKENKNFFLENYNIYVKFIGDKSLKGYECRLLTGKE